MLSIPTSKHIIAHIFGAKWPRVSMNKLPIVHIISHSPTIRTMHSVEKLILSHCAVPMLPHWQQHYCHASAPVATDLQTLHKKTVWAIIRAGPRWSRVRGQKAWVLILQLVSPSMSGAYAGMCAGCHSRHERVSYTCARGDATMCALCSVRGLCAPPPLQT
jgi:hypothetical protein